MQSLYGGTVVICGSACFPPRLVDFFVVAVVVVVVVVAVAASSEDLIVQTFGLSFCGKFG